MTGIRESGAAAGGGSVLLAGRARLPRNAVGNGMPDVMILEVEMDPRTMGILRASSNCLTHAGEHFLAELLVGRPVAEALDDAEGAVKRRFFDTTQRAFVAALHDVRNRLQDYLALEDDEAEETKE